MVPLLPHPDTRSKAVLEKRTRGGLSPMPSRDACARAVDPLRER
jgi:hypothetical protein